MEKQSRSHPQTNTVHNPLPALYRQASKNQASGRVLPGHRTRSMRASCSQVGEAMCRTARLRRIGRTAENLRRGGRRVLFEIWRHSEQPCGKRLVPMLGNWLPSRPDLEAILKIVRLSQLIVVKKISPVARPEARSERNAGMRKSPVGSGPRRPCGGDMGGLLWTLTATDIYRGWTEVRSSWNRGQHNVCTAFEGIEQCLPFAILGVDTDNGGEFAELSPAPPLHGTGEARRRPSVPTTRTTRRMWSRRTRPASLQTEADFELLEAVWRNCFTTTFKQISKSRGGNGSVARVPCPARTGPPDPETRSFRTEGVG